MYGWRAIHQIYKNLPYHLQEDVEVQKYLTCFEHFDDKAETQFDGPIPLRIHCTKCRLGSGG